MTMEDAEFEGEMQLQMSAARQQASADPQSGNDLSSGLDFLFDLRPQSDKEGLPSLMVHGERTMTFCHIQVCPTIYYYHYVSMNPIYCDAALLYGLWCSSCKSCYRNALASTLRTDARWTIPTVHLFTTL